MSRLSASTRWKPCPEHEESGEYDSYLVNQKFPKQAFSHGYNSPWLNELCGRDEYAYKVLINSQTAEKKGIKDGDEVWIESVAGRVKGIVKVTELVHPEVIGTLGQAGHWAKNMPVAKGKGVHTNTLIPYVFSRIDKMSANLDACVKVKVHKEESK